MRPGSRTLPRGVFIEPAAAFALSLVLEPHPVHAEIKKRFPRAEQSEWLAIVDEALFALGDEAKEFFAESKRAKKVGSAEVPTSEVPRESKTMTTAQTAKRLGVSDRRVRQLIESGALSAVRDDRGPWRIDADSVGVLSIDPAGSRTPGARPAVGVSQHRNED